MSSIDRLLIQGIRSFGAGDSDRAVITFGTPLTLITGQNGAGKTTIIECLKYVTTGDQPPNTKGGAFVHDPKLIGETQVRGVVKLKFRDITGCVVTCHRMLQAVQKIKKIEVKTLDSSLEKIVGGEKKKLTKRCADIDREMIEHLGVSKAILSSVIFCHQEESTWPLSEGKALKQRFDEIFASTRYSKALESIRKVRIEQNQECKVHSNALQFLKKQKTKAEELEANMKELQEKVERGTAEITRLKSEIKPIEDRIKEMDNLYTKADSMKTRIAELESSRRELERNEEQLAQKIQDPFTGTQVQLEEQISDSQHQLKRNKQKLSNVEKKQEEIRLDVEEADRLLSLLYQEHGRREAEHKHHSSRVKDRDNHVVALGQKLHTGGQTAGPFSADYMRDFLLEVDEKIEEMAKEAQQQRLSFLQREESLQKQGDDLRTNLAQLEQSLKIKREGVKEAKDKLAAIERELGSLGSRGNALESLDRDISTAERELEEARSHIDIAQLEREVKETRSVKKKEEERETDLTRELTEISRQASSRGVLEELRKDRRAHEEEYQNKMSLMEGALMAILGHIPTPDDRDLVRKLKEVERTNQREMKSCEQTVQRERSELSRLQAQLEGAENQLASKTIKMEALQQKVVEVCEGSEGYQEALTRLKQDLETNMSDLDTVKGSHQFFRKSLEKLQATHKCPLCTRSFQNDASFQKTVKSVTSRLNESIPRLLPQLEEKRKQLLERQRKLQQLQPKIEELSHVRDNDIPQLELAINEKQTKITRLQTDLTKTEKELSAVRSKLEQVRELQPRVSQAFQLRYKLEQLDTRIGSEESKMATSGPLIRGQMVVNRELQEARMKMKELELKIDHKQSEILTSQREIRELEGTVNQLRNEKLKLQEQLQKREGLVMKKEELTKDIQSNSREINVLSHRQGPVQERLSHLEREKKTATQSREETERRSKEELDSLRSAGETIKSATQRISRYIREGHEAALEECGAKMSDIKRRMQEREAVKQELEEQKAALQEQVANTKVRERDLEDSLCLIKTQEEVERKRQEAVRLREQMREMGLDRYDEEYQKLQQEQDKLRTETAHITGVRMTQQYHVEHNRKELQGELYKDAAERHKTMLVTLKTTELAVKDLDKYYKCLDRAIMRYHKLKMEEINKILRELWMKTYRGGDIDSIEIRSDDDAEEDGVIKTRRVYHYRVVMIKDGTVLDMRGRCSAGQKVLASVLIRLALAESFCINCGLLALDEPTTNLDRENIEGLAQALADIVKDRCKQKNFQMIVITHDKGFVDMMGQAGYTEYYFEVSKQVGECSCITRRPLSGMER